MGALEAVALVSQLVFGLVLTAATSHATVLLAEQEPQRQIVRTGTGEHHIGKRMAGECSVPNRQRFHRNLGDYQNSQEDDYDWKEEKDVAELRYPSCESLFCFSTRRGYLASPIRNELTGRPCSMTFDYQAIGGASRLVVHRYSLTGFTSDGLTELWASTEATSSSWVTQSITINFTGSFQVVFEGQRRGPAQEDGIVRVDNVEFSSTCCAIDGGWSPWTDDGTCSASCGGGQQLRSRQCNSPLPQNGGSCSGGAASETVPCNEQLCPTPPPLPAPPISPPASTTMRPLIQLSITNARPAPEQTTYPATRGTTSGTPASQDPSKVQVTNQDRHVNTTPAHGPTASQPPSQSSQSPRGQPARPQRPSPPPPPEQPSSTGAIRSLFAKPAVIGGAIAIGLALLTIVLLLCLYQRRRRHGQDREEKRMARVSIQNNTMEGAAEAEVKVSGEKQSTSECKVGCFYSNPLNQGGRPASSVSSNLYATAHKPDKRALDPRRRGSDTSTNSQKTAPKTKPKPLGRMASGAPSRMQLLSPSSQLPPQPASPQEIIAYEDVLDDDAASAQRRLSKRMHSYNILQHDMSEQQQLPGAAHAATAAGQIPEQAYNRLGEVQACGHPYDTVTQGEPPPYQLPADVIRAGVQQGNLCLDHLTAEERFGSQETLLDGDYKEPKDALSRIVCGAIRQKPLCYICTQMQAEVCAAETGNPLVSQPPFTATASMRVVGRCTCHFDPSSPVPGRRNANLPPYTNIVGAVRGAGQEPSTSTDDDYDLVEVNLVQPQAGRSLSGNRLSACVAQPPGQPKSI